MDGKIAMEDLTDLQKYGIQLRMQCIDIAAKHFGSELNEHGEYASAAAASIVDYADAFYAFVLGEYAEEADVLYE